MFNGFLRNASFYKIKAYSKVPIVQKVDCQDLNASEFLHTYLTLAPRGSFPGAPVGATKEYKATHVHLVGRFKEGVI